VRVVRLAGRYKLSPGESALAWLEAPMTFPGAPTMLGWFHMLALPGLNGRRTRQSPAETPAMRSKAILETTAWIRRQGKSRRPVQPQLIKQLYISALKRPAIPSTLAWLPDCYPRRRQYLRRIATRLQVENHLGQHASEIGTLLCQRAPLPQKRPGGASMGGHGFQQGPTPGQ